MGDQLYAIVSPRHRAALLALVPLVALGVGGCCKRKTASTLPSVGKVSDQPRPLGKWSVGPHENTATYASEGCDLVLTILAVDTRGQLRTRGCGGVQVTAFGESWTGQGGSADVRSFPLAGSFGALRPGEENEIQLPARITLARGGQTPLALPGPKVRIARHTSASLGANVFHTMTPPFVFEGEATAAPERARTAFVVQTPFSGKLLGPGKTLAEVDYVARSVVVPRGEKRCEGYQSDTGKGVRMALSFRVEDLAAKIVDRRTGALLASRTFPADKTCPRVVAGRVETMRPDETQIAAWVAKEIGAHVAEPASSPAALPARKRAK